MEEETQLLIQSTSASNISAINSNSTQSQSQDQYHYWQEFLQKDRWGTIYQLCQDYLKYNFVRDSNAISLRVLRVMEMFPENLLRNINYQINYGPRKNESENLYELKDYEHRKRFKELFVLFNQNPYIIINQNECLANISYKEAQKLDLLKVHISKTIIKYSQKQNQEQQRSHYLKLEQVEQREGLMKLKPDFIQVQSKPEPLQLMNESIESCWIIIKSKQDFLINDYNEALYEKLSYFLQPDKWNDHSLYVNKQILFEFYPPDQWLKSSFIIENSNLKNNKSLANKTQFYSFISNNLKSLKKLEVPKFKSITYSTYIPELKQASSSLNNLIAYMNQEQTQFQPLNLNELVQFRQELLNANTKASLESLVLRIIQNLPQLEIISGIAYQIMKINNQIIYDPSIQQETVLEFKQVILIKPNETFSFSSLDSQQLKTPFQIVFYNNYQAKIQLDIDKRFEQLVLTLPYEDCTYQYIYVRNLSNQIMLLNQFRIKFIKSKYLYQV